MNVSEACAEFVVSLGWESVPQEARRWAQWAILDATGVMLAGSDSEPAAAVRALVGRRAAGEGAVRVTGQADYASPSDAALIMGTAAHALDFDDVGGLGHTSAVLVPVLYALGEGRRVPWETAMLAYVAGYEVGSILASRGLFGRIDSRSHRLSWHPTSVYGAVAAAATSAVLIGLDARATQMALGIAASMAGGVLRNFGTMTKPLHAGLAARAGVQAALLAASGLRSDADALGGDYGFLAAFSPGSGVTGDTVERALGHDYALCRGIAFKRFPACWSSHRAVTGVLNGVEELGIGSEDVKSVSVNVLNPPLIRGIPHDGFEAKFSMLFNVALACQGRLPVIDDYGLARIGDPEIGRLMDCVVHREDRGEAAQVAVMTRSGRQFETEVQYALGDPHRGLDETAVKAKFDACYSRWAKRESVDVRDAILGTETYRSVGDVVDLIAGSRCSTRTDG